MLDRARAALAAKEAVAPLAYDPDERSGVVIAARSGGERVLDLLCRAKKAKRSAPRGGLEP